VRGKRQRSAAHGLARYGPSTTTLYVEVHLTRAELRRLEATAAESVRSIGSLLSYLVMQELERPRRRTGSAVLGASSRDRREPYSVRFVIPKAMRRRLESAARAELRSVSGYVGRVLVEALARK
jgi:hypothetical protein